MNRAAFAEAEREKKMIDYIWNVVVFVFWFQVFSILVPLAVYAVGITFVVVVGVIRQVFQAVFGRGREGERDV